MHCPICTADLDPWVRTCESCGAVRTARGHWLMRGPRGRRVAADGSPAPMPRAAVRVLVLGAVAVFGWGCASSAAYTAERQDHDQVISAREACHEFIVAETDVSPDAGFEPLAASTTDEVDGEYIITGSVRSDPASGLARPVDYRCVVSDAGSHWKLDALSGVR